MGPQVDVAVRSWCVIWEAMGTRAGISNPSRKGRVEEEKQGKGKEGEKSGEEGRRGRGREGEKKERKKREKEGKRSLITLNYIEVSYHCNVIPLYKTSIMPFNFHRIIYDQ